MTDTINEARVLARGLRATGNPLVAKMVEDVADECERLRADLEAARAELAAAREAMPSEDERQGIQTCVVLAESREGRGVLSGYVREWLARLAAYHAAHPAASTADEVPHAAASRRALDALAQMGPSEVRQTFVDAGIVDASGRLTEAYGSAPKMSDAEFVAAVDAIIAEPEMQELLAMDRAAPDLPEPCAVCKGSRVVQTRSRDRDGFDEFMTCRVCTGRADGGEVQNG